MHVLQPRFVIALLGDVAHLRVAESGQTERRRTLDARHVDLETATLHADTLDDALDRLEEADVVDGPRELDVSKMTRALGHVLRAGLTLEVAVDRAQPRVRQTARLGPHRPLLIDLRAVDRHDRERLDLVRRQDAELHLLDPLDRRARVGRHGDRPGRRARPLETAAAAATPRGRVRRPSGALARVARGRERAEQAVRVGESDRGAARAIREAASAPVDSRAATESALRRLTIAARVNSRAASTFATSLFALSSVAESAENVWSPYRGGRWLSPGRLPARAVRLSA